MTSCAVQRDHYKQSVQAMIEAVGGLKQEARDFYYKLVLHGLACPECGHVGLIMIREGRFRCRDCGQADEPTITFQRCPACDGLPALIVRRYRCRDCGEEIVSRFLFDGTVYNAEYFRERMAQSRVRRQQSRKIDNEQQAMRAWQRTSHVGGTAIDLQQSLGLIDALNSLVGGASPETVAWVRDAFDLAAYERHILDQLDPDDERDLVNLPGLYGPADRIERIRNFIACLFLEHTGLIQLDQRFNTIWVSLLETD